MKNVLRILGIIALVAVIGFGIAACSDGGEDGGGGGKSSPITDIAQLTGTWKGDISFTAKYEDIFKEFFSSGIMGEDSPITSIDDLKNIKPTMIIIMNEANDTNETDIEWDDFVEFLTEDDEMMKMIFPLLGVNSWTSFQSYINNALNTSVTVKAGTTVEVDADAEATVTINSASVGLSDGMADTIFLLLPMALTQIPDDETEIKEIIALLNIDTAKKTISLKEAYTIPEPMELDVDGLNEIGAEISSDGKTFIFPIAEILKDEEGIDISKWVKEITFKKQ